jgi:hypothetical protein
MLGKVRERILDMDEKNLRTKDPDRYLRLINEQRRINKRIEEIGKRAKVPGAESEPAEVEPGNGDVGTHPDDDMAAGAQNPDDPLGILAP